MDFATNALGHARHLPEPAGTAPAHADATVDLRKFWGLIVKRRLFLLGIVAVAIVLGIIVTLIMTPIYRATTAIQIEREATKVLEGQDVQPVEQAMEAERFLQTQIDLLGSRTLALEVADALGLQSSRSTFLTDMGVSENFEGLEPARARALRRELIIKTLSENLNILWTRNSRVVRLTFDSPDAGMSQRIVNMFATKFIASNLERRFQSTAYARDFLQRRLDETKNRLEASERQMIAYAREAQLIDASDADRGQTRGPRSLTTASLVQLNDAYSGARAARIAAEQRWRASQSGGLYALPEVLANPAIQEITQKLAELRSDYQNQRKVFKPDYPALAQLNAQIAELRGQLDREAANIRNTIRTQYDVARQQELALSGDVDALKTQTLNEQQRSIRFNILRREADTNRQLYDALLQRFKEISIAGGVTANNISIVDLADAPNKPIRPNPIKNLLLAAILGMIAGLSWIFIRDRFDDTVRTPDDLQAKLGLPLVGLVPIVPRDTSASAALEDARSDLSEAYASIRAALQFSTSGGAPTPLLVTSSQQSEGKSTTSLAIATSFARIGQRVLLIDGDLRRPSLHNTLGLGRESGLSDVLASQRAILDVAQKTDQDNLWFVSCGPLPPNPSELLAGSGLQRALTSASDEFDLVIVDGPPVMGLADAPMIGAAAHATLFVIESGRTHRGQSKVALSRLRDTGAPVIGAILTKFDRKQASYGTDYAYSYTYDYK